MNDLAATIMSIDDDKDVLAMSEMLLRKIGYNVITSSTPQNALEMLSEMENKPHLILLDIAMPEMDGYTFCEELQKNKQLSVIPVVFLTAHNSEADRQKAFSVGAVDFLSKPVTQSHLYETVKQHIDTHKKWMDKFSDYLFHGHPSDEAIIIDHANETALIPHNKKNNSSLKNPTTVSDFTLFKNFLLENLPLNPEQHNAIYNSRSSDIYAKTREVNIESELIARQIATYFNYPYLKKITSNQIYMGLLPTPFCKINMIVPLQLEKDEVGFAICNPFNLAIMDTLLRFRKAKVMITLPENIELVFGIASTPEKMTELNTQQKQEVISDIVEKLHPKYMHDSERPPQKALILEENTREEDPPLIQLVNRLIEEGYESGASDIHIEPQEHDVLIRYRIDGELKEAYHLEPQILINPIITRLKIMSNLNIGEKRLPQDGRIIFKKYSRNQLDFDIRLATSPMNFGEKAVLRIIDKTKSTLPLDQLGFSESNLLLYRKNIRTPYGMILHVGPTGSGKSMTLYSALHEIQRPGINIQTAEDPIEYTLPGINQMQTHANIGLTFATALRSFLRQDPDVILVGEIRDRETANIAVEAALTGHLLLSTLHTNDAASTVTRFIEMGIDPFLISSSLILICAQRLIRQLCNTCKKPVEASEEKKRLLHMAGLPVDVMLYEAVGCPDCKNLGYKGRIGVHEILIPNNAIRQAINTPGITSDKIKEMAMKQAHMQTLFQDAMSKAIAGIGSIEDILSKVKPDEGD